MCVGSVQPSICHSPGAHTLTNLGSFFQPSRIAILSKISQIQTASVWTYGAEEFVQWLVNLSHTSVAWLNRTPERADMPATTKHGWGEQTDYKATMVLWHAKDLFPWDTPLYVRDCKLPLVSGNKQDKCCSSENAAVLHLFDILLTDPLLPKVIPSCFLVAVPYFFF